MNPVRIIETEILLLLKEKMAIDVPSAQTDLMAAGHMDSLMLAELLTLLETDLAVRVPLEDLELDQIRNVAGIARVVARQICGPGEPGEEARNGDAATVH